MKKFRWMIFFLLILPVTFIYFCVPVFIFPDSYHYLLNSEILLGEIDFSNWYIIRGPSLSLYFFPFLFLLGTSIESILLATYFSFVTYLAIAWQLLTRVLSKLSLGKLGTIVIYFSFLFLVLVNPLLFGYFHTFLTEFLAILLGLLTSMLVWDWSREDLEENRGKSLLYLLVFAFLVVFSWFLKQPYISTTLIPIFAGIFLSVIRRNGRKDFVWRVLVVVISFIFLFSFMSVWDGLLVKGGTSETATDFNTSSISRSVISGLSNFRSYGVGDYRDTSSVKEDILLREVDKLKISSIINNREDLSFKVFNVFAPSGEIIAREVMYYRNTDYSFWDSLVFALKLSKEYPLSVLDSYLSNYLGAINVYKTNSEPWWVLYPIKEFNKSSRENFGIGLSFLYNKENLLWLTSDQMAGVQDYYSTNPGERIPDNIKTFISDLYLNIFKGFYLLLPLFWIYSLLKCLRAYRKDMENLEESDSIIFILLSYTFFHTLLHIFTGAMIDRYLIVPFPAGILAFIFLLAQWISTIRERRGEVHLSK
jgi:hypothetical protein